MDKDYWNLTDVMLISKTNLVFSGACAIACTLEDITFLVICQPPSCFATKPTSSCDFSVSYIFPWWLFLFPSEIFPSQCHQMDPPAWGEKKKKSFFLFHTLSTLKICFQICGGPKSRSHLLCTPWMEAPPSVSPVWANSVVTLLGNVFRGYTPFFKCCCITLKTRGPLHNSCWCLQIKLLAQHSCHGTTPAGNWVPQISLLTPHPPFTHTSSLVRWGGESRQKI